MRRTQTEQARNMFLRYGFMPCKTFRFQGNNKNYRVFDEVNNKFIKYNYGNFLKDISSGKVVEVDPFLHVLQS